MKLEPEDQQIIDLLARLKEREGTYPRKLFASRRRIFLSQMTSIGLGLGAGSEINTAAKTPRGSTSSYLTSMSASTILEAVLLVAIVIQAGMIVYSYRSQIAEFVNSLSTSPTSETLQIPVTGSSSTNVVVSDTPTATITMTASVTPSPSNTSTNVPSVTSVEEDGSTTSSDPSPGITLQPTNDNNNNNNNENNGNHYGQTPGPPQPKEEPKPTKNKGNGKQQ